MTINYRLLNTLAMMTSNGRWGGGGRGPGRYPLLGKNQLNVLKDGTCVKKRVLDQDNKKRQKRKLPKIGSSLTKLLTIWYPINLELCFLNISRHFSLNLVFCVTTKHL